MLGMGEYPKLNSVIHCEDDIPISTLYYIIIQHSVAELGEILIFGNGRHACMH